jgi:hypothetical protein
MSILSRWLLLWSPRFLGICTALFVGLFALDALDDGVAALLLHLVPALSLLTLAVASWRHEWLGAAGFITLGVLYAVWVWPRGEWLLVISGPLLLVGVLFLWSWRRHDELRAVC